MKKEKLEYQRPNANILETRSVKQNLPFVNLTLNNPNVKFKLPDWKSSSFKTKPLSGLKSFLSELKRFSKSAWKSTSPYTPYTPRQVSLPDLSRVVFKNGTWLTSACDAHSPGEIGRPYLRIIRLMCQASAVYTQKILPQFRRKFQTDNDHHRCQLKAVKLLTSWVWNPSSMSFESAHGFASSVSMARLVLTQVHMFQRAQVQWALDHLVSESVQDPTLTHKDAVLIYRGRMRMETANNNKNKINFLMSSV